MSEALREHFAFYHDLVSSLIDIYSQLFLNLIKDSRVVARFLSRSLWFG